MITPERIIQVGMGFWPARTLQTAVKLGLFTELGKGPLTAGQLRERLGLAPRAVPDFTDALVALRFVDRAGDGQDALYSNSEEAALFLDAASPAYVGGFLEMAHDRLYPFWGDLGEALRTGEAQNESKRGMASIFETVYSSREGLEQFLAAMSGISTGNFRALAEKFDFSPYRTLCDVGGAEGMLAMTVARGNPHMQCTTADLAAVEPIARDKIAEAGLSDRVRTAVVDFFEDELPKADILTMGMILHDWDLPTKKMLIAKVYDALPVGGAFIAVEQLIDDARRENVFGLMMSLNMLVEGGDAFDYTGADFTGWCTEAGFRRCEVLPLAGPSSAAIAYK
jgi:O-methyltransferase domain/Dimerisation domain